MIHVGGSNIPPALAPPFGEILMKDTALIYVLVAVRAASSGAFARLLVRQVVCGRLGESSPTKTPMAHHIRKIETLPELFLNIPDVGLDLADPLLERRLYIVELRGNRNKHDPQVKVYVSST